MPRLQALKPRLSTVPSRLPVIAAGSWRSNASGSSERGYTYAWQKARVRFLTKHPLCEMCKAQGRTALASVVDHKVPHRGDPALFWDETNWQSLCKPHHDGDKQRMENRHAAP